MDDFGGMLRQARERRGISLRQIAASTKISAGALEALERNDISKLPGGIFSRAFVRSYALEVGLDPEETVRQFIERFKQDPPPTAEMIAAAIPEHERAFDQKQRKAMQTIAIAAAVGGVLLLMLYVGLRGRRPASRGTEAVQTAPLPQTEPAPAPPAVPPPVPPEETTPLPSKGQLTLDISPTADCWVSLTVDGKKLFARVMRAGERESHAVRREAVVEVGDAGAFAFSVNGRPGKALGDQGQVKTLKLTPATVAQYVR